MKLRVERIFDRERTEHRHNIQSLEKEVLAVNEELAGERAQSERVQREAESL